MIEQIVQRVIRLAKLDFTVFKEIEEDKNANIEALVVVVVSAFLAALGSLISGAGIGRFFGQLIFIPVINWLLWSLVTMFVGTRFFAGEADFWEVARCLGYATIPVALGLLAFIPCIGALIGLIGWALSLVLGFLAIREALDLPTDKALLTVVIGWVIVFIVQLFIFIL